MKEEPEYLLTPKESFPTLPTDVEYYPGILTHVSSDMSGELKIHLCTVMRIFRHDGYYEVPIMYEHACSENNVMTLMTAFQKFTDLTELTKHLYIADSKNIAKYQMDEIRRLEYLYVKRII